MSTARPVRTLLFSTLYPSSVRPVHGIFVETRLREWLKRGNVQTRVVAPVPWFWSGHQRWGDYGRWQRTPRRETWHGIDVLHPRYLLLPKVGMTQAPLALALGALGAVRQVIAEGFDFDAIDAHYYYPDGVAAALLARWLRKPLAITARGTDLNLIPQHALPRWMMRWAAGQAQASIGVCKALVDVLQDWDVDAARLHVIRNGVDLERFSPQPPAAARAALGLTGSPVLLSVGHLIERKGNHLTLQAMPEVLARHPGALLVLVGEGPEHAQLTALAGRLGITAQVRFVGAVANEELARWYSAADITVLASSREGWANVLLESMACGTPVVATSIWGTPEVVGDPVAGELVAEHSPAALAGGVLRLLQRLPDRRLVRQYAEGFGWEHASQRQQAVFAQLAHGGQAHA